MGGTPQGGIRARETNYARHGKDFYRNIGKKGGTAIRTKPSGFATMPIEKLRKISAHSGKVSKRGMRLVGLLKVQETARHSTSYGYYHVKGKTNVLEMWNLNDNTIEIVFTSDGEVDKVLRDLARDKNFTPSHYGEEVLKSIDDEE